MALRQLAKRIAITGGPTADDGPPGIDYLGHRTIGLFATRNTEPVSSPSHEHRGQCLP
ncbi:hypothetical protein ABT147_01165 [Streptomyces sp. NPDC001868]|uniref:hypothetical protein n=1 Tax=Streptomyces sp. NPDC001868 TaxID=3154401 RepID=UPI003318F1AD